MLCAPSNRGRPFSYHTKMADFEYFRVCSFSLGKKKGINLNMVRNDSQIDKPQHGHPKRAGLPDVNINTGVQKH